MRALYWNCTSPGLGGNSFAEAKKGIIQNVIGRVQPQIICLDEMSETINDSMSANAYATNHLNGAWGNYSSAAVVNNPGVHLNTATWIVDGMPDYKKTETGIPNRSWGTDRTKRDLTRSQVSQGIKLISVWFVHANASRSGGTTAAGLACDSVQGSFDVFIGDFNCPIGNVRCSTTAPAVNGYNFTQWRRHEHGTSVVPNHFPPIRYDPHGIIDFAINDPGRLNVTAVDAVSGTELRDFIVNFDHFPIAYDIT